MMMMSMVSKVCAIVGVGQGLGLALVERFAKEGFTIAMMSRKQDAVDSFVKDMSDKGYTNTHGYAMDSTNTKQISDVFERISTDIGNPEVLIYNAAAMNVGPPMDIDVDVFTRDMQVDIVGALACIQAVYPGMKTELGHGKILLTGGGTALKPQYSGKTLSVGVGKAGLRAMTIALHQELKSDNIHVGTITVANRIQPGTFFDPVNIANTFYKMYEQPEGSWDNEIIFAPPPDTSKDEL